MKRRMIAVFMALVLTISVITAVVYADNKEVYSTSQDDLEVTDVSYDPDAKEVTFKFNCKTQYRTEDGEKDISVRIHIANSKANYVESVKKCTSRKLIVNSKKLKYGYKYIFSISGVRKKGTKKYVTITGTFRAIK